MLFIPLTDAYDSSRKHYVNMVAVISLHTYDERKRVCTQISCCNGIDVMVRETPDEIMKLIFSAKLQARRDHASIEELFTHGMVRK